LVAAVVLWAVIYHTRFGVMLRATSQDRRMASALGLNVGLVYVLAFGIGCFLAGLGGAIVVPTQAAVLGMGIDALVIAFVVVVIGGGGGPERGPGGAGVGTAGTAARSQLFFTLLFGCRNITVPPRLLAVLPTRLFGTA